MTAKSSRISSGAPSAMTRPSFSTTMRLCVVMMALKSWLIRTDAAVAPAVDQADNGHQIFGFDVVEASCGLGQ